MCSKLQRKVTLLIPFGTWDTAFLLAAPAGFEPSTSGSGFTCMTAEPRDLVLPQASGLGALAGHRCRPSAGLFRGSENNGKIHHLGPQGPSRPRQQIRPRPEDRSHGEGGHRPITFVVLTVRYRRWLFEGLPLSETIHRRPHHPPAILTQRGA